MSQANTGPSWPVTGMPASGQITDPDLTSRVAVEFIYSNEPRLIAFHEYLSEDGTEVEYVQVHPDTDSFENHMRVVERSGRAYTQTLEGTTNIRIYGTPSQAILDMLSKAAGCGVPMTVLPEHLGGFTR